MPESTLPEPPNNFSADRVRETERARIARDLHDELGSRLTAIKMALAQLAQQLPVQDAAMQKQARYADQRVDDAIGAMHDIIDDLHPAVLDLGLSAALEWLARTFTRQTGVAHRLLGDEDVPATLLDAFQAVSLYRIAREALHNAGRHAQARNVSIGLRHAGGVLTMEVADDGVGLENGAAEAASRTQSSGIRGMQRRAAAIGAVLTLQAGAHGGVKLTVSLPALPANNLIE